MKLRIARHTNNLAPIVDFYTKFLELQLLGSFENHDGYDGVFLGLPTENWHLEFTVSDEQAVHNPGDDDLLVFYCDTEKAKAITGRLQKAGYKAEIAKNPYWNNTGVTYTDPDGYRIVIVAE